MFGEAEGVADGGVVRRSSRRAGAGAGAGAVRQKKQNKMLKAETTHQQNSRRNKGRCLDGTNWRR